MLPIGFSWGICVAEMQPLLQSQLPGSSTFYICNPEQPWLLPCNSSPTFPTSLYHFICRGQQYCFNHGAYDTDGDSTVYQLITPKQTAATTVNYIAPLCEQSFELASGYQALTLDTGDICMTPQALEVTVMAVNVLEYRNGVLIGSVEQWLWDYSNELHEHSANTYRY